MSPWVKPRSVCHTLFDHATIPKTILQRFCRAELEASSDPSGDPHRRGKLDRYHLSGRIAGAADLGEVLTLSEPRPAPDRSSLEGP